MRRLRNKHRPATGAQAPELAELPETGRARQSRRRQSERRLQARYDRLTSNPPSEDRLTRNVGPADLPAQSGRSAARTDQRDPRAGE